jgi:hypothetical protein
MDHRPINVSRRIHGRKHAGVRLVQEGVTLMRVLDSHKERVALAVPAFAARL